MKNNIPDDSLESSLAAEEDFETVSKSQIKRQMHALQELGETLCSLPFKVVNGFALDENLLAAYQSAQTIHSNSAKKRHRQFVGKVLRKLPSEDIDRLKKNLDEYANRQQNETQVLHHIEAYRDKILSGGDKAINQVLSEYPLLERSYLRQLVRNANKEREKKSPPKSARLLFKYLKENIKEE